MSSSPHVAEEGEGAEQGTCSGRKNIKRDKETRKNKTKGAEQRQKVNPAVKYKSLQKH